MGASVTCNGRSGLRVHLTTGASATCNWEVSCRGEFKKLKFHKEDLKQKINVIKTL